MPIFFGECLFKSFAYFLIRLFVVLILRYWAAWSIYIFWRLIPCQLLSLQMAFCFVNGFLCCTKFKFSKIPFVFVFITLGGGSKDTLLQFMSESSLFSSKSFMLAVLTFRSVIHFKFIFVCGVSEYSNFILLLVAVQFFQHHLLKRLHFLHCIFLPTLS